MNENFPSYCHKKLIMQNYVQIKSSRREIFNFAPMEGKNAKRKTTLKAILTCFFLTLMEGALREREKRNSRNDF